MQEARYGRMKQGRCLDDDFGYIGCGTSVLDYFDEICSGKQSCKVDMTRDIPPTHLRRPTNMSNFSLLSVLYM